MIRIGCMFYTSPVGRLDDKSANYPTKESTVRPKERITQTLTGGDEDGPPDTQMDC